VTVPAPNGSTCPSCGAGGRTGTFCSDCGARLGGGGRRPDVRWLVAGGALVLLALLAALFIPEQRARAAAAAPAGPVGASGQAPPDLSTMTPRQQFDRLYARALEAAQSGDDAGAAQFMPMAMAAYGMLDTIDADARYHAALLHLHAGNAAHARLLADTILVHDPGHLFGYLVRATAARWERDDAALQASYRDFLAHDAAESARGREEYDAHRATIDETRRLAREAVARSP
jgi:hypothetical protein